MSSSSLSTNLLSIGLFDIAYSIDVANDNKDTLFRLFQFCAIALFLDGYDAHAIIPDLNDESEETVRMFERTDLIMSYINERHLIDQTSPKPNPETTVVARSISKLLGLQLPDNEDHRSQAALDKVRVAVESALRLKDGGHDGSTWLSS